MGDHAIALAETQLLKKMGIDYVEITGKRLEEIQSKKCLNLMNGSPIFINGGGNLGTLWYDVEQLMRDVVIANPKSPIYIMPNTIYYEDSEWGSKEFERSKEIYNAHKNLHIFARERISYAKMKDTYSHVKLVPDMVLSLNWSAGQTEREGCLLCIRNDCERLCTEQEERELYDKLHTIFGGNICRIDTHAKHAVPIEEREQALKEKYMEFRKASLVVTDRLHGMIFCAITGTPCIVINSRSPKVKGCYEWIKDLEYVQYCDSMSDVLSALKRVPMKDFEYDNRYILRYYDSLIDEINSSI